MIGRTRRAPEDIWAAMLCWVGADWRAEHSGSRAACIAQHCGVKPPGHMHFNRNKGAKLAQQLTSPREHRPQPPQFWGDAGAAAPAWCIPQFFLPLKRAGTTAALRCSRVRGFTSLAKVMWGWLGIFHWDGFQHILAHSKISGFPRGNFCFMGSEREMRTKCCTSALLRQLLELGSVIPPPERHSRCQSGWVCPGRAGQSGSPRTRPWQGAASCKDSGDRGSILSLLSPRDWGSLLWGTRCVPSPAGRAAGRGARLLHPPCFSAVSSALTHPDSRAGGGLRCHTSNGSITVGLWRQADMEREICRVCPAGHKPLAHPCTFQAWEDICPERGTRSWGKPTPAAAPAKLSK